MPHVIQKNGEAVFLKFGKVFALKDYQIAVAFGFPAQCLQSCRPVCYDIVELGVKRRDSGIGEIGGQFVVVIDQNDRYNGSCPHKFVTDIEHFGHVGEINRRKLHSRCIVLRSNIVAVDTVASPAYNPVARQFGLTFAQPTGRKARDHGIKRLIAGRVGKAGDGKEAGVSPDDLVFRQPNNRHRECGTGMDGNSDGISCSLYITHELTLAPGKLDAANGKHNQRYNQSASRQIILPQHGSCGGEKQHDRKIPDCIGIEQPSNRLFHIPPPPLCKH